MGDERRGPVPRMRGRRGRQGEEREDRGEAPEEGKGQGESGAEKRLATQA